MSGLKGNSLAIRGSFFSWIEGHWPARISHITLINTEGKSCVMSIELIPVACILSEYLGKQTEFSKVTSVFQSETGERVARIEETLAIQVSEMYSVRFSAEKMETSKE